MIANGSYHGAVDTLMIRQLPPVGDPMGDPPNLSGVDGVANDIMMKTPLTRSGSSDYFKKSKMSFRTFRNEIEQY